MITIDHLSFSYHENKKKVLQDVTFEVPSQKIITLLGPNGSGKSTLLKILARVEHRFLGSITHKHEKLLSGSLSNAYSQVGFMPQVEYINPTLSSFEYVLLGRSSHVKVFSQPSILDKNIAWNNLELMNCKHLAEVSIGEISGGQLQLVRLARVLSQQALVVLLDEPTTHLDMHNRRCFIEIISNLPSEGISIVLATHDPEIPTELGGNVVLLSEGRVIGKGSNEEMITGENLSTTFGYPIQVVMLNGKKVIFK